MSTESQILKMLIHQARVNSHIIGALGVLAKNGKLGDDTQKFIESVDGVVSNNSEFIETLRVLIDKLHDEAHG